MNNSSCNECCQVNLVGVSSSFPLVGMLIIKTANRATGVYRLVTGVGGGGGGRCSASNRQIELRMTTLWSRGMLSIKTANRATAVASTVWSRGMLSMKTASRSIGAHLVSGNLQGSARIFIS